MTKTSSRIFPTAVVLSISSGRMLCAFSEMHEAIECLVGVPVWTHQLADKQFVAELKASILKQRPQLADFDASAVSKDNWQVIVKAAIEKYGVDMELSPMGEPEHYEGAFTRPLAGKKVIVV